MQTSNPSNIFRSLCVFARERERERERARAWWHYGGQEGPYVLRPVFRPSPECWLRKSTNMYVRLVTDRFRPRRVACRPLPLSTPLIFSGNRSILWCVCLFMFTTFRKPLRTFAMPSFRPDVMSAVLASLTVHSLWLRHGQGSRTTAVCAAEDCARLHASLSSSSQTPPVRMAACVICVSLWEPSVCDRYLHSQTGCRDSVGNTFFVCSPSILLDCEDPTRPVPCDWAVRVEHSVIQLAVGFVEHLHFGTFFFFFFFLSAGHSR